MSAWTEEQKQYLRDHYADTRTEEIAEVVGHSCGSCYTVARRLGLQKSDAYRAALAPVRKKCIEGERLNALLRVYPYLSSAELSERFGIAEERVRKIACLYGVKKDPAYIERMRENFYDHRGKGFEKGCTPWNKGKKVGRLCPPEYLFQKGRTAHHTKPLGYRKLSKNGYWYEKVSMTPVEGKPPPGTANSGMYKAVHYLEWEKEHGPLPADHCLVFIDGDKNNTSVENLYAAPRRFVRTASENIRYGRDIADAAILVSEFKAKIKEAV